MMWELASSQVVGGMRPADGAAPFARGGVVLGRADAPGRLLQVRSCGPAEAEGAEIDLEDWEALLGSGQAFRLREPSRSCGDALWVFRPEFPDREGALDRLSRAGALAHREETSPEGPIVAIVREHRGNAIRDALAARHFDDASRAARAADWPEALARAELAFALTRGLVAERVALLALALEHAGRKTASEGLIETAAGSRGGAFGQAVRERKTSLEQELAAAATSDPERRTARHLAHVERMLEAMPRCAEMWGSSAECLELQALLLLEQRSALGRPVAYWRDQDEVRGAWIAFAGKQAGHPTAVPHFCAYEGRNVDEYAPALRELIAFVRERLPLEAGWSPSDPKDKGESS